MPRIDTGIRIDAPPAAVWATLVDTAAWPEWNPLLLKLKGTLKLGEFVTVVLGAGKRPIAIKPQVVAHEEGREFRWRGSADAAFVFTGEHHFIVQADGAGTRFVHGERFSGLLAGPLLAIIGGETKAGFVAMNEALKARCEAG